MKNKNLFVLVLALLVHLSPLSAPAKGVPESEESPKAAIGAQHFVVPSQVLDDATEAFEKADSNHDGLLDTKEANQLPPWLKDCKAGRQGEVSIIDIANAALKKFKDTAKTNSKFLTEEEYKSLKEKE
jgi:hypothetical protein